MKKILILMMIWLSVGVVKADELVPNARSAILIEPTSKTIIYEKDAYKEVSIASLTKMMGLLIIFEKIDEGKIKYTDTVVASANASGMGGSQIWLSAGEEMSVEDLLKGIIMASANDVVVIKKQSQVIGEEITIELL